MQVLKIFIPNNPLRNFNYIIYSEVNQDAIFIDPLDIDTTITFANELNLKPKYLINTHYHHDHMRDNEKYLKLTGAKEIKFNDQEEFNLSKTEKLKAYYTPGHLDPHFCFELFNDEKAFGVITGDVLFNAGIGNAKQGDVNVLYETISKVIMNFSNNLIVYPAHDYIITNLKFSKTVEEDNPHRDRLLLDLEDKALNSEYISVDHTIEDEKKINPFLRLKDIKEKYFPNLTEKEVFIKIRNLRDKW
jgi:hydroxyacylglutathione hydrolase